MSVIVRGMEMPNICNVCPLSRFYSCGAVWCNGTNTRLREYWDSGNIEKPDWCPLEEVVEDDCK